MSRQTWGFTLEGVPGVKARARSVAGGRPRKEGRTETFERRVAGAALEEGIRWLKGFVFEVRISIYLPDFRAKDGDNIAKVILDGLQKAGPACLPNDDLFHVPHQEATLAGVDRGRPRTLVEVLRRPARGAEAGSPERHLFEAGAGR